MRNILVGCLAFGLTAAAALAAGPAAEPAAEAIAPRHSKAVYLGLSPQGLGALQRSVPKPAAASGDIDAYNVWTSFEDIDIFNDLSLEGHSYVMCSNFDDSIFYGHLIYSYEDFIEVRVKYDWSIADRLTATVFFDLNGGPGYFLLVDEFDIDSFDNGYYKLKVKYTVTGGGNGSGKESCFFDVFTCN